MANYDLYKNINPGSVTSATSSLRQKVTTSQSKLDSFSGSLSDGMWKADSKATLKDAFSRIDSEVYADILAYLDKLDTAADLVSQYNDAKTAAETYKSYINSATDETPASDINSWKNSLATKEKIMEDCEAAINGLK